jgi:hypothetical protein
LKISILFRLLITEARPTKEAFAKVDVNLNAISADPQRSLRLCGILEWMKQ